HLASTAAYTVSLHDALPISRAVVIGTDIGKLAAGLRGKRAVSGPLKPIEGANRSAVIRYYPPRSSKSSNILKTLIDRLSSCNAGDRKSTRLNSSHGSISYAV